MHTCVGFPICTHVHIYVYMHTCTRLSAVSINSGRVIPMNQQPHSEHTALSRFHRLHSDSKCGGFHPSQFSGSPHQLGIPQFDFDTDCLVSVQTPQTKGCAPRGCPHASDTTTSPAVIGAPVTASPGSVLASAADTHRPTVHLLFAVYPEGTGWNQPTARVHGLPSTSTRSPSRTPPDLTGGGPREAASCR